jgi:uncharacterized coiled-coil protein SlyX
LYQKAYIWNRCLLILASLQPAERLWQLSDEPLANKSFETLDELEQVLAERCCIISQMPSKVQALTNYHWWPDPEALETG